MARPRVKRREELRQERRRRKRIQREIDRSGLGARMAEANRVLATSSLFWQIFKARVRAIELVRNIVDNETVRGEAMAALRELGVDMSGVQLKVMWDPPRMNFLAVPTIEVATEVAARANPETAPR